MPAQTDLLARNNRISRLARDLVLTDKILEKVNFDMQLVYIIKTDIIYGMRSFLWNGEL